MLKPGDLIGPYEIRGFVGQGGMGQVYRAFDPRLERTVALKVIVVPDDDKPNTVPAAPQARHASESARLASESSRIASEFSARLLREARAVASLSHPNVVAIFDVGSSEGRLYLAMEYVVGATLRSLVGNKDIQLSRKVRWLVDVAYALEAAHKAGIIHRDVKPENVMVREDGGIKVLDFGIARRAATSPNTEEQHRIDTITGGGAIAGTPVYMAPEQIKGGVVDARCDQFAWGVTAYELIAGERPWAEAGDVLSLVANVLTEPPRSLRERVKEIPALVEEAIGRALAKDPTKRFPSMADVAEALEPFASQSTGDRVRITPPSTPKLDKDDPAYAATTRVPTTVSVPPAKVSISEVEAPRAPIKPTRRVFQLAVPLALIGALVATVYVVKKRTDGPDKPTQTQRPLSTVVQAEASYKEAMSLWHDGATAKARTALRRAIELDPAFAAAHLELAIQTSMDDPVSAQQSYQSAFEHRAMLVARDSALLEACEPYVRPNPDLEEWETRMTSVVFQFPRDPELQYYLGRARERQGEDDASKNAYEAAVRLDEAFVPGLAALASVERNLGRPTEALATTDKCLKRSPVATTCVETRVHVLNAMGECHRAREDAAQWGLLEPQSPRPFAMLARALHADGAPRPSVEEVLARRWSLLPNDMKKTGEKWDRVYLMILDGDLMKAEELAREYDGDLLHTADAHDHASPAQMRVNLFMEVDRMKDASKVAKSYLDRMAAWAPYPFGPDPSMGFYEPIYRAGEMTKPDLEEKRIEWVEREKKRAGRSQHHAWTIWLHVHGGFVETREEAIEALAALPGGDDLPAERRPLPLDFALGKVYALAGKPVEALPHLQRVIGSCASFDIPLLVLRARYYAAQANETKGDAVAAKAGYERIIQSLPKSSGSRTVKKAEEKLALLTRD